VGVGDFPSSIASKSAHKRHQNESKHSSYSTCSKLSRSPDDSFVLFGYTGPIELRSIVRWVVGFENCVPF